MHGHLVRSLHSASPPKSLKSLESQWVRARFALEEVNDRQWEVKRRACVKAMRGFRVKLTTIDEVEDEFALVDANPSMAGSTTQLSLPEYTVSSTTTQDVLEVKGTKRKTCRNVRAHHSFAGASPNNRRQCSVPTLRTRKGTHVSSSNKARIGVKKKSPIAVRFRRRLYRSNRSPLEAQLCRPDRAMNNSRKLLNLDSDPCLGNTPVPGSIVTAEIITVQPSLQESIARKRCRDFTFTDWFIAAMFVLQYLAWITLGCLFASVVGS
ncbi:uncharacterized protein NECHADRAFT_83529 [Fusarium vanettenii 77-13-4]|uniref:Uncharacterized protein n=1 Tax=Fusarium vanettenii (strain ATCC MYA-4622 / CBS 123669 / FGSC 9596 / NRRL 45880 / 77-13-4) TaxID=660122 RepID=C7Z497_FUSV7|nr:uncharacterized protein NECHADRAFT_83529 [Fusarium vanettenii 77-13-4]EEU41443.1 predicted protein [Fusarium vanettenii 77-13-4]